MATSFTYSVILGKSLPLSKLQFSLVRGAGKLTRWQVAQASPSQGTPESQRDIGRAKRLALWLPEEGWPWV